VAEGAVFVLELAFGLRWLHAVAVSSQKVKYCIVEKTKNSFVLPTPEGWHPVAVLV